MADYGVTSDASTSLVPLLDQDLRVTGNDHADEVLTARPLRAQRPGDTPLDRADSHLRRIR